MLKFSTFLMFYGKAEEAMKFYMSVFKNSEIKNITRYKEDDKAKAGIVQFATLTLNGEEFMVIDSNLQHDFTFTPAMSIYIKCDTEIEVADLYAKLSDGGQVLMPLDKYPFSEKYGWVNDKFGVSWQLGMQS